MILNKIYDFFDPKYAPIISYFYIIPPESIESELDMIYRAVGCMRDFYGYELEEDGTITFYDFTSNTEKSINISIPDLVVFLNPIIQDYLKDKPDKYVIINDYIELLLKSQ